MIVFVTSCTSLVSAGINWLMALCFIQCSSMPTINDIDIMISGPGVYDPEIGPDFPFVYPPNPFVGDTVLIECWASGRYNVVLS